MRDEEDARARVSRCLWKLAVATTSAVLLLLLVIPLLGLIVASPLRAVVRASSEPLVIEALVLSLQTTMISLAIIVATGTPLAWVIARRPRPRVRWLETLVELPVVIPPAVVGVALLFTFGRRGPLGAWLDAMGVPVTFTAGAVVMAQVVVAAPFYVQAATASFRALDPGVVAVARSLGASPARLFFRIAIPLAGPGLATGAALAWARALGEFGATLLFAGNFPGHTQTLPLAIYTALESDLAAAQSMSLLLVLVAFALLLVARGRLVGRITSGGRDEVHG